MALNRLRRVLESQYSVRLTSNARLVERVNTQIRARAQELLAKGKPAPPTKRPAVIPGIEAGPNWSIRAIDLLHKLGLLTTPAWVNMAQLSASLEVLPRPQTEVGLGLSLLAESAESTGARPSGPEH